MLLRDYVCDGDRGGVSDRLKKRGRDSVVLGSDCERGCDQDCDYELDVPDDDGHGCGHCYTHDQYRGCGHDRGRVDHHYEGGQNGRDYGVIPGGHGYCVLLSSDLAFSEVLRFGSQ